MRITTAVLLSLAFALSAVAASKTIPASDLGGSTTARIDLGCEWDGNTTDVQVWGLYDKSGAMTVELIDTQKSASGNTIVLTLDGNAFMMEDAPLAHIQIEYQTAPGRC